MDRIGRDRLMAWSQRFVPAVPLPGAAALTTLADARRYILDLPPEIQALPEWQVAIEALLLVGNHGGDPMLPRIGIMRALYQSQGIPQDEPRRRKLAKTYKIIR